MRPPHTARLLAVAVLVGAAGCGVSSGVATRASSGVSGQVKLGSYGGMPRLVYRLPGDTTRVPEPPPPAARPSAGHPVDIRPLYRSGLVGWFRLRAGPVVASDTTDAEGRYRTRVPPGRYVVVVRGGTSTVTAMPGVPVSNNAAAIRHVTVLRDSVHVEDIEVWDSAPS